MIIARIWFLAGEYVDGLPRAARYASLNQLTWLKLHDHLVSSQRGSSAQRENIHLHNLYPTVPGEHPFHRKSSGLFQGAARPLAWLEACWPAQEQKQAQLVEAAAAAEWVLSAA